VAQLERDRRMVTAEGGQQLWDQPTAERAEEPESHRPGRGVVGRGDLAHRVVVGLQDRARVTGEDLAGEGQPQAAAGALRQRHPELVAERVQPRVTAGWLVCDAAAVWETVAPSAIATNQRSERTSMSPIR
jgi:hypothetical protein